MTKKIEAHEPLDDVFQEFINTQKKATKITYRTALVYWLRFTRMNGKATLEFRKNDKDSETEKKVLAFNSWLKQLKNPDGTLKSENSARTLTGGVRGFFSAHRMPLRFISGEKKRLQESNRSTQDYLFSKEDLAKMSEQASLTERYVLLFGKSVGLRASDFLTFTYGDFRSTHLDTEAPISLGERITKKEHVPAFPFVDSDSIPIIKAILERNPEAKNTEKILDWEEESLTQCLQRLFEKAHLENGGKTVRFHNLRKYLFDKLSCVMSQEKAKQIVGKKISESAYLTTESLRECYVRAMPSICINGNGKNHVKIEAMENTIVRLEKELKSKDTEIEILRKNQNTFSKSLSDILSLPTIKKEFERKKEEVGF